MAAPTTTLPIRGLGSLGVITDADPYNLPINAFTRGKNIRFSKGDISRSPAFRTVTSDQSFVPVHVAGVQASSGYDTVVIVTDTFDVHEYASNGGSMNQRHTGGLNASTEPFTSTSLADVQYINRSDHVPIHRGPLATSFTDLTHWPSSYRTTALRSYGDFRLALNTTESNTSYPNRVRWSNIALANSIPDSWDATDTTKSAGFNDLVQMATPIVDGATLGSNFMIYSRDQVWLMEFVGGAFIFNFRKIFDDCGVISQNCVQEVEGRHYVFDHDDIYVNDGVSRQSICDGRVRDYIFSGLDASKSNRCFVHHNEDTEEVYFCYHSGDDLALYTSGDACNRAAVYNYKEDNWSFLDLPNVIGGTHSNIDTVRTYATATTTYANTGGSYHDQESLYKRHNIFMTKTGGGVTEDKLVALDHVDEGSINLPIDTALTGPVFLERKGIDLDGELGLPLTGYKVIKRIVPQISTVSTNKAFQFTFGAANLVSDVPTYASAQSLDISADYKVDSRVSGRYLSYKLEVPVNKDFTFGGMDFDVVATGRR